MTWLDIGLLLALLSYVGGGFGAGLIQSVGGLIGLILGSAIASRQYEAWAPGFASLIGGNELLAKVLAFATILFIITRIVAILVWFLNKIFNFVAIIPGLKLFNRLGGAIFGFLEGAIFLGLTLQLANRLPVPDAWARQLQDSFMVPFLLQVSGWLVPFLPKVLKETQPAVDRLLGNPNFMPSINGNLPINVNINSLVK